MFNLVFEWKIFPSKDWKGEKKRGKREDEIAGIQIFSNTYIFCRDKSKKEGVQDTQVKLTLLDLFIYFQLLYY